MMNAVQILWRLLKSQGSHLAPGSFSSARTEMILNTAGAPDPIRSLPATAQQGAGQSSVMHPNGYTRLAPGAATTPR